MSVTPSSRERSVPQGGLATALWVAAALAAALELAWWLFARMYSA